MLLNGNLFCKIEPGKIAKNMKMFGKTCIPQNSIAKFETKLVDFAPCLVVRFSELPGREPGDRLGRFSRAAKPRRIAI